MEKLIKPLLLIMGIFLSLPAAAIEKPEYEIVRVDGDVEFRRYTSFIVAETDIVNAKNSKDASNEGFRRLFNYITGDNNSEEKIAMTAPVQQSKLQVEDLISSGAQPLEQGNGWTVSFMLPSSYSLIDAPIPEDERIRIRVVPEKLVAAIRYSGRWTARNFDKHESRLMQALSDAGIETVGVPESAFYNPPFVPPFMRRNEILVEVVSPLS